MMRTVLTLAALSLLYWLTAFGALLLAALLMGHCSDPWTRSECVRNWQIGRTTVIVAAVILYVVLACARLRGQGRPPGQ